MSQHESSSYQSRRRKANEFSTRSEYLEHELNILRSKNGVFTCLSATLVLKLKTGCLPLQPLSVKW